MRRPGVLLAIVTTAVTSAACSGGATRGDSPPPRQDPPRAVADRRPVDGVIDWDGLSVQERPVALRSGFGAGATVRTTAVRWAAENDDRDLYLAFEWDDATENAFDPSVGLDDFDGLLVLFDADGDGTLEQGEDARRVIANIYGSTFTDMHMGVPDPQDDAVGDGLGKLTWAAGKHRAELLVPLADGVHDPVPSTSTRVELVLYDHVQLGLGSGNIGTFSGGPPPVAGASTASWQALPWKAPPAPPHPEIPSDLTGLIAFISDHETPQGEIYTFDPANGTVTRVTSGTGLFMEGVSLSHDRTRVAFHGAPSRTAYSEYEIYTVGVDGAGLTSITHNALLDGHPGWSPDDSEIVYASYRDGVRASLVRMTAGGTERAVVTPSGADDNDPDWLPDGRIVFKTDRFSTAPEVRIAVMDANGANVVQLTDVAGSSDHDPVTTATVAVFERFPKGTNYSTDPSTPYTPWDIVEARVDGGGERTLVSNGWVNWLPVPDPTGRYLVYLRSVGYTDARIMTADGQELGRLIPGQTRIRYIDWK